MACFSDSTVVKASAWPATPVFLQLHAQKSILSKTARHLEWMALVC